MDHHRGAGFFLQVASRDDCGQAAAICLIKRPGFCAQGAGSVKAPSGVGVAVWVGVWVGVCVVVGDGGGRGVGETFGVGENAVVGDGGTGTVGDAGAAVTVGNVGIVGVPPAGLGDVAAVTAAVGDRTATVGDAGADVADARTDGECRAGRVDGLYA